MHELLEQLLIHLNIENERNKHNSLSIYPVSIFNTIITNFA